MRSGHHGEGNHPSERVATYMPHLIKTWVINSSSFNNNNYFSMTCTEPSMEERSVDSTLFVSPGAAPSKGTDCLAKTVP